MGSDGSGRVDNDPALSPRPPPPSFPVFVRQQIGEKAGGGGFLEGGGGNVVHHEGRLASLGQIQTSLVDAFRVVVFLWKTFKKKHLTFSTVEMSTRGHSSPDADCF